jgi:phospholipid/cholesterol/gamma-HCH transport system substrate-binding protein
MEREANYFAVGAFVILVTAMAGLFVYWYSEGRESRDYVSYEIYFPGSITGLTEGSSVRYLGVEVGKVRRIRLDPRSATRVQIIAEIDQAAPVSKDTTAELSMLSFATGILYIDLRQNQTGREVLPPVPSERYPVINTVRSGLDAFMSTLPEVAGNVADLLERTMKIFSAENTTALAATVKNLNTASGRVPETMDRLNSLLTDLAETSRTVRGLAVNLQQTSGEIAPQIRELTTRLTAAAGHLEQAGAGIESFVAENRASLSGFAQDGLPQLQRTLEEARDAATEVRELSRSLKENPSRLIYRPAAAGIEVPR